MSFLLSSDAETLVPNANRNIQCNDTPTHPQEDEFEEVEVDVKYKTIKTLDWERVNANVAVWARDKDEVTDEEYHSFYKVRICLIVFDKIELATIVFLCIYFGWTIFPFRRAPRGTNKHAHVFWPEQCCGACFPMGEILIAVRW